MTTLRPKFNFHLILALPLLAGLGWYLGPDYFSAPTVHYQQEIAAIAPLPPPRPVVKHLPTPESVKAVYLTACAAATTGLRDHVIGLIDRTELNAVVVDLKDYTGRVAFPTVDPNLQNPSAGGCFIANFQELTADWHERGIYIIGRVTVFQDPYAVRIRPELAVKKADGQTIWRDKKGLSFIDVGARPHWDYIIALSREAYELGVDELNFDYIRFPSDGNMQDISFPFTAGRSKAETLEEFFVYLSESLRPTGAVLSADLFGMTTTAEAGNDLNIGQVFTRALPHFDYLAPMVYPSHYPPQFFGYPNPNTVPYEVVKIAMDGAIRQTLLASSTPGKIRPWLQDFDYGGNYDVAEVRAQIQAVYDAGLNSWMVWDPRNHYTPGAYQAIN